MICVGNLGSVSPSNAADYLHWGTATQNAWGRVCCEDLAVSLIQHTLIWGFGQVKLSKWMACGVGTVV